MRRQAYNNELTIGVDIVIIRVDTRADDPVRQTDRAKTTHSKLNSATHP